MADLAPSATCVAISYDGATNQRVYVVEGAWSPGSCYGQVLVIASEYGELAFAAGSGGSASGPAASAFTEQEITSLKFQAANPSPFSLDLVEGSLIGSAILAVWGMAAGIKAISRMFQGGTSDEG